MSSLLVTVLGLCLLLPTAFGFNWNYPVAARQCSPFTVLVNGTDVVFPLRVLIVPVGPSPLAYEVRKVLEIAFPTDSMTVNFTLPYPTNSKFVGLVADASGYRGTASTWTVLSSTDASCFDATKDAVPTFNFTLTPTDVAECKDVRIWWDPATVQGTPSFLSVIPDGAFGTIPLGKIDAEPGVGTGFTWRPAVRASTNLIIVAGDTRGTGVGGFISNIVSAGDPTRDATGACVAPAATTTTSRASTSLFSSSATPSASKSAAAAAVGATVNVGAVIGGVIGGIAVLAIFFFLLHRLLQKKPEPQVPSTFQQYAPVAPNPALSNPAFYGAPPPGPYGAPPPGPYGAPVPTLMPTPPPQWGVVPQEPPGHVPMQVAFTGQSATTAMSGSGYHGSSWKGSPAQTTTTGQWSASNDNVIRPTSWDGRP